MVYLRTDQTGSNRCLVLTKLQWYILTQTVTHEA